MYHIAICDDDRNFIQFLEEKICLCGIRQNDITFHEFLSGKEFVSEMEDLQSCDLLILEVQMERMDGNTTAKHFRRMFPDSVLVFCSGVFSPMDELFKTMPYRFLQKNYSDEKMLQELEEIVRKMMDTKSVPYIVGRNHYNLVRLKPNDILYIENDKRGSQIHVREEMKDYSFEDRITTKLKLAELYGILKEYGFEYAHNSYLVNMNFVIKLCSKGFLKLVNGRELNVSRSRLKVFRQALSDLIENKDT